MGKNKKNKMPKWARDLLMQDAQMEVAEALTRRPGRGTRDLIADNIWVGDLIAARTRYNMPNWTVVDVREGVATPKAANVAHCPILLDDEDDEFALPYASPTRLEAACAAIDAALADGKQVLVHCWQGLERSPLTLVYWLTTRQGMTVPQAYAYVKRRRAVYDRRAWLRSHDRTGYAS